MRIESLFRSWEAKEVKLPEAADLFKAKYAELKERLWAKFVIDESTAAR